MQDLRILAACVLPVLGACSTTEAPAPAAASTSRPEVAAPVHGEVRAWEHESSDVPVDPRIRFGHFDNGLRWAWAENPEPNERCYLRLHVDVGSLAEEDDERGMAHFLEHMAFNGSENFAAGTLIEWFQEHGMSFGADTNAHTSFSETVYKLDLPTADEETLREGLLVLRDFATGMLLREEEVQNEKGVIDGEQRERDSAGFRVFVQELDTMFAGTRYPERLPIGVKPVRDEFTAESVRAFYERWYRPENMTLVAVGDLGDLDPSALFAEYFADMPVPDAPLRAEPDAGRATRFDHSYAIYEEEIPSLTISVERLSQWEEEPFTVAEMTEDIPLGYARAMLNLRFSELAKAESAPFLGASVSSASALEVFDGEGLSVTSAPADWEAALAFCEKELRRALEFGFQQAELDEVRANTLRGLDEAVERQPTAHSRGLLSGILAAAENRYVPTSAETDREIIRPVLEALSVEDCHAALREAWDAGEFSIRAVGGLDMGAGADEALAAVWTASAAVPIEAGTEIVVDAFAYASTDAAGEIVSRETISDLEFESLRFANGVAVNIKRTDFKEQQIILSASLGEGGLTLEPDQSVVEWVGSRIFNGGGLEAHSEDDLRRLMAGKQVGVGFGVGDDAFSLSGATTAEDLTLQCELMCAYLEAPGWREDGLIALRRQVPLYFEGLKHQPQGPVAMEFFPELYAGDPRRLHPSEEQIMACDTDRVREWLAPELAEAPLEVSIVGDLDLEQTIAIAARTFGMLPERRAWRDYEERKNLPAPLTGVTQEHSIETQVPKSLVLVVFPTTDGIDAERRRRLNFLNSVVNDRLRIEVREKLGAAYSPGSSSDASTVYPGVGMLVMQAMADPDKTDTLVDACLAVADDLAREGVTQEEVDRLREPILTSLRDAQRTNGYWMGVLSESQRRPEQLDDMRALVATYEQCSAEDLSVLAAAYLGRERASLLVVNPTP